MPGRESTEVASQFYACRHGVWYQTSDLKAPFTVATSVPDALRRLPPECPYHNVSYVYVYESDPTYVWCGYTPGYMGWYTWYGCPIYGTGIYYPGWYHRHVYPMPHCTWGMRIHYNSYSGWGVSVGVGGPRWSIGISTGGGYGGWYGPGGGNTINIDNSNTINIGNGSGNNVGNGNRPANRPALYDRVPGADRPKLEEAGNRLRQPTANTRPAGTRENLAVDRDGNIARPTQNGGWQTRENGAWKERPAAEPRPAQKPAERPKAEPRPATRPNPKPSFERTQQQRSRGEQRVQQRAAPARSHGGGGGGSRR